MGSVAALRDGWMRPQRRLHRLRVFQSCIQKLKKGRRISQSGVKDGGRLTEVALKNVALEAVRTGNYWAPPEEQGPVLEYIANAYAELLQDKRWLKKHASKLEAQNGLTKRYTLADILSKKHEADGYNVFLKADQACLAFEPKPVCDQDAATDLISAGTTLIAKKETRIFAGVDSWDQIGLLSSGQHVQAESPPVNVEGCSINYCMIDIRPKGAVELRYMNPIITDSENVNHEQQEQDENDSAADHDAAGITEELRKGIAAVTKDFTSGNVEKTLNLLELLEGCAKAGEIGAAVFCGERLEALHGSSLPAEVVNRSFAALKPLLKHSLAPSRPQLDGPWSKPPPGRVGVPNVRKALGQILNRLATARKQLELSEGGEETQRQRKKAVDDEAALRKLCHSLAPILAADESAVVCRRRGAFSQAVTRLCAKGGLQVSQGLAYTIVGELETLGILTCRGRDMELCTDSSYSSRNRKKSAGNVLAKFVEELEALERFALDRLERRKKRQKARERGRIAKRLRADE